MDMLPPHEAESPRKNASGFINWTAEEDADLKARRGRGQDMASIAKDVGRSRNSVIGRCHRIGISIPFDPNKPKKARVRDGRSTNGLAAVLAARAPGPKPNPRPSASTVRYGKPEMHAAPLPLPAAEPPTDAACDLFDLTNDTCRFPLGALNDPPKLFCGDPNANLAAGMPYCARHAQHCYAPQRFR